MNNQPYAPVISSSSISYQNHNHLLNSEIHFNSQESYINESLAEIYSILITLEIIEKSFIKNSIDDDDKYTEITNKLINQYNTILKNPDVVKTFQSLTHFISSYKISKVNNAIHRLNIGIPATVENSMNKQYSQKDKLTNSNNGSGDSVNKIESSGKSSITTGGINHKLIAEITGNFITLMDALKLNYKAKDQLYPLLSDLITNLNKFDKNFENRGKLIEWLIKLNKMTILDELIDDEVRLLLFDLENSYKGFYTMLE